MNNNISQNLLDKIKAAVSVHCLIKDGDRVLVALSGGADSVCLLDALCRLKAVFGIKIGAAHLNHMIRGAEADRDEAYAAELCTRLNIPFYAERVDVPALAKKDGISEEAAGRRARYDFFERLSKRYNYNKIATAHNKNDKAETVLMRIFRGTGIDGLSAIKYKREDNVIRPILDITRSEIEKYCEDNSLSYCTDSTNSDTEYTRNRIRTEIIPLIEKSFNPSVIDALCVLSDNASEDAEFINGYTKRLYNRINSPMPKRKPDILDIESLKMLDNCIFNRIIRITACEVMGSDYHLERTHIDAVRDLLSKHTGTEINLPGLLSVSVKYGWLEFKRTDAVLAEKDFSYEIEINGSGMAETPNIKFEVCDAKAKTGRNQMILDYDKIKGTELTVRNRRMGDRMAFFKDGRMRKIKDYWIDKKVPRGDRARIPLLCSDNKVIAIIGDRVAETYKITGNTEKGLVITYVKDGDR